MVCYIQALKRLFAAINCGGKMADRESRRKDGGQRKQKKKTTGKRPHDRKTSSTSNSALA